MTMFERYTEKARRVIFFARYEASEYGSPYIETEHLLLGIVREARFLLTELAPGIAPGFGEKWHAQLEPLRHGPKTSTSVDLPLSNESTRVLTFATEEANRMGSQHVGVEHLVLGLLRERHSASSMLESVGIKLQDAREHFATHSYTAGPEDMSGGMGAGSSRLGTSALPVLQFVEVFTGEQVAIVSTTSVIHLPRADDVVEFQDEHGKRSFRVKKITHVFEGPRKRAPYHGHDITKIVVTVERVEDRAE